MQLRETLKMIGFVCKNLENLDSINYFWEKLWDS